MVILHCLRPNERVCYQEATRCQRADHPVDLAKVLRCDYQHCVRELLTNDLQILSPTSLDISLAVRCVSEMIGAAIHTNSAH